MEKKVILSLAIATFNEERNLDACLSSVSRFVDEIIVVDGGSKDKTVQIASRYTKHIIKTDNPPIFHINKQKALDACTGEWILQLDADEIVTDALRKEIEDIIRDTKFKGFYIPRKNFFWGHMMKKGGQYPDYVIRLVKRGYATFPCKSVHEQIEISGEVGYLKNPLLHYSYRTKEDYWKKADTYTTLTALELKRNNIPRTISSWITYSIWKPIGTFFQIYFRHKGFLDGWHGFVFAYWSALHHSIAYKKYIRNV